MLSWFTKSSALWSVAERRTVNVWSLILELVLLGFALVAALYAMPKVQSCKVNDEGLLRTFGPQHANLSRGCNGDISLWYALCRQRIRTNDLGESNRNGI
jgi:hypothetical protein